MLIRKGDEIYEQTKTGFRLYAVYTKGSWCKPTVNGLGVPELDPVLEDEGRKLALVPEWKG